MLKLYGYWRSTAAYRVRIALNYKQIDYVEESVHLVKDGGEQHKAEYKQLNAQGLVPTLVDEGVAIGQSIAILEYLQEKHPKPTLLPTNALDKAKMRQLCQIIACDLHPLNNLRVLQYLSNEFSVSDEDRTKWYHHWLSMGFRAFESLLQSNDCRGLYCMGGELSMADACLIPQIYNADRFGFALDDFPRISEINANCLKLAVFDKAKPENQADSQ